MEVSLEVSVGDIVFVPILKLVGEIVTVGPKGEYYQFLPTVAIAQETAVPLFCQSPFWLNRNQVFKIFSPKWKGMAVNVCKARNIVQDVLQKVREPK